MSPAAYCSSDKVLRCVRCHEPTPCGCKDHSLACGSITVLGPEIDHGGCINQTITCVACGRIIGENSTRKDLATPRAATRKDTRRG